MADKKYRFYVNKLNKHLLSSKSNKLESLSTVSNEGSKTSIPRAISDSVIEDVAESLTANAVQKFTPIMERTIDAKVEDIERSVKTEMHKKVCRFKDQIQEAFGDQDRSVARVALRFQEIDEENSRLKDINESLMQQLETMNMTQKQTVELMLTLEEKVDSLISEKEAYIIAESPTVIKERQELISERDAKVDENEILKIEKSKLEIAFVDVEDAKKGLEIDNLELSTNLETSVAEKDSKIEENASLKVEQDKLEAAYADLENAKKSLEIDNMELSTDLETSKSKFHKMKTLMLSE